MTTNNLTPRFFVHSILRGDYLVDSLQAGMSMAFELLLKDTDDHITIKLYQEGQQGIQVGCVYYGGLDKELNALEGDAKRVEMHMSVTLEELSDLTRETEEVKQLPA